MAEDYPRDLVGYGENPPDPKWPNGARLALNFVLNYEEGGEACILHGDDASEANRTDVPGTTPWKNERNLNVESMFEYGSRAGFWRIMRQFRERGLHFTAYAVGMALERAPENARAMVRDGHEIASHGYRWINYRHFDEETEREHMRLAIAAVERTTGSRPLGWFTGRISTNTRRLVVEEGGFLYDSDSFADDLPYWVTVSGRQHLIIPYSMDCNDVRFAAEQPFNTGAEFLTYLKDAFDVLYAEGASSPKMMTVGLHCRLIGRPGRAASLASFLDYVLDHPDVWICRRVDIARHWIQEHPPAA